MSDHEMLETIYSLSILTTIWVCVVMFRQK